MSDAKTVQNTLWIMILAQTIGSVDLPGQGARKLPSPRAYVAIIVLWTTLGAIAETRYSKLASRMSVALVITGAVLGPFGQRFVSFLKAIANLAPASVGTAITDTANQQGVTTP